MNIKNTKASVEVGVGFEDYDVIIVVGGKEFYESSYFLRSISGFFKAAFRSGMKESQTMRFEFPDKKPEQWELIMSLARPFPNKQINKDNFTTALSWFDELDISFGRQGCDRFAQEQLKMSKFESILSPPWARGPAGGTVDQLFGYLQACYHSNLVESKDSCVNLVRNLLTNFPSSMLRVHWAILCSLLAENEDCHKELFGSFARSLPSGLLQKHDQVELCSNVLLPDLVFAEVQRKTTEVAVQIILEDDEEMDNYVGPAPVYFHRFQQVRPRPRSRPKPKAPLRFGQPPKLSDIELAAVSSTT